jgi:hypothetical protein
MAVNWKVCGVVAWTVQISTQTVCILVETWTVYKCYHSENLAHNLLCISSNLGINLFSWHTLWQLQSGRGWECDALSLGEQIPVFRKTVWPYKHSHNKTFGPTHSTTQHHVPADSYLPQHPLRNANIAAGHIFFHPDFKQFITNKYYILSY